MEPEDVMHEVDMLKRHELEPLRQELRRLERLIDEVRTSMAGHTHATMDGGLHRTGPAG